MPPKTKFVQNLGTRVIFINVSQKSQQIQGSSYKNKPTTKRLSFRTNDAAVHNNLRVKLDSPFDYIFNNDDAIIQCKLGGVLVNMVIDSGSRCNVIGW